LRLRREEPREQSSSQTSEKPLLKLHQILLPRDFT
jgi:hypothetical protein